MSESKDFNHPFQITLDNNCDKDLEKMSDNLIVSHNAQEQIYDRDVLSEQSQLVFSLKKGTNIIRNAKLRYGEKEILISLNKYFLLFEITYNLKSVFPQVRCDNSQDESYRNWTFSVEIGSNANMLSFQKKFSVYCHRDHLIIGYLNSSQSDNDQIDSLLFKQYHKMEPNSLELIKKLQNLNKVFEEDLIEIFFFMNTKQIYFNMPTIEVNSTSPSQTIRLKPQTDVIIEKGFRNQNPSIKYKYYIQQNRSALFAIDFRCKSYGIFQLTVTIQFLVDHKDWDYSFPIYKRCLTVEEPEQDESTLATTVIYYIECIVMLGLGFFGIRKLLRIIQKQSAQNQELQSHSKSKFKKSYDKIQIIQDSNTVFRDL